MATTSIDPITQEILASAFHHIAEEMAVVEYRSSYSPIIREMLDFNCGLFTADGRMVANSEQIPAQLGLMQFALESVLDKWGDDVNPGDAVLTNNPYMGGTHTPDLQVFTPLFRDGALMAWAGSIAHHIDIGGRFPAPRAPSARALPGGADLLGAAAGRGRHPHPRAVRADRRQRPRPRLDAGRPRRAAGGLPAGRRRASTSSGRPRHGDGGDGDGDAAGDDRRARRGRVPGMARPRGPVEGFMDDGGFEDTPPFVCTPSLGGRRYPRGRPTGSSAQVPSGMNVPIASTHAGTYFAVRAFLGPRSPRTLG